MGAMRKILGAVVVGVIVIASILFFIFGGKETIPTADAMARALATDSRAGGIVATEVVITKETDTFVRGSLVDGADGGTKTFYAMKIGDVWRIVDITASPVSCERFARLGFPEDFYVDCVLLFSDAVTVAEIDATFDAQLLLGAQLQVIGFVTDVVEGVEDAQVTVTSGGESATLTLPGNSIKKGDVVVVTVEDLSSLNKDATAPTPKPTTPTYTATRVVRVGEEDDELVTSTTPTNPLPQETNTTTPTPKNTLPVTGVNGKTIYKINAPNTAPPRQYFFNVYDIDTSFEHIRIDGSF